MPPFGNAQLKLLEKLCNGIAVSGDEGEVRRIVLDEVKPYADEVRVDALANVLAIRCGQGRKRTSPVMDESGKPALAVHVIRDITSRKKTEEALRQSEHRYEVIAQETGYLVYDHDIAGRSVRWSGAIDEVTGFSKDELNAVGAGGREEMVHPDDRLAVSGSFADARAKGGKYRIAYRLRRKDGSYIRIEDRGMFIQNDQGKPVRMLGLIKKADRAE